ncbi:MAG: hypothetical protein JW884_04760 [Deltaproteobacteria bacterium]|nr:hypothetical protein [Deltaproteobacteria bacterium]
MKKLIATISCFFAAIFLVTGCQTTKNITTSIEDRVTTITGAVDQGLYEEVPEKDRKAIESAESRLAFAAEKFKLAKLKKELADNRKKMADYEEEIEKNGREKAEATVNLLKWEAISKADLGKPDVTTKTITNLKSKILKLDADTIDIQAKMTTLEGRIESLSQEIDGQTQKVKVMETEPAGAAVKSEPKASN